MGHSCNGGHRIEAQETFWSTKQIVSVVSRMKQRIKKLTEWVTKYIGNNQGQGELLFLQ